MKKRSLKHKKLGMPAEFFMGHVATDGSLLGTAGQWGACGGSGVQLDFDEAMGPLAWDVRLDEAEFEVQARRS